MFISFQQIEKLQSILDSQDNMTFTEPLPLPLDPTVKITGVVAGILFYSFFSFTSYIKHK